MDYVILLLCTIAGYAIAAPIINAMRVSSLSPYQQRKLERIKRERTFKRLSR